MTLTSGGFSAQRRTTCMALAVERTWGTRGMRERASQPFAACGYNDGRRALARERARAAGRHHREEKE
jgi:hypothetical protein